MTDRAELLEAWLAHPGMALFQEYVKHQWGPIAYAHRVKAAIRDARARGLDASLAVERVDAANDAIADIMRWAQDELTRAKRPADHELPMSRGGYHR